MARDKMSAEQKAAQEIAKFLYKDLKKNWGRYAWDRLSIDQRRSEMAARVLGAIMGWRSGESCADVQMLWRAAVAEIEAEAEV